ncbi:zinc transporter 5-like [Impatiens glandulifera]|uniref:zinc transporter 5-like n=1 Tax=Impatiens glandulifera TaxID=253017 RepID=UPI001FB060A3|nr:zinc transporter 5-like [Impatiens glandulifera]
MNNKNGFLRLRCGKTVSSFFIIIIIIQTLFLPSLVLGQCNSTDANAGPPHDRKDSLKYKIGGIASILTAGAIGISLPLVGRKFHALSPESDIFFMIKAFAAGVILATAFIHILPAAFDGLGSPCLKENPWRDFPFAGLVAMMASIGTLMVDSLATGFYKRIHGKKKTQQVDTIGDEEGAVAGAGTTHVHVHGAMEAHESKITRLRIISQVLEVGIIVHSLIIGISLGASGKPGVIKSLLAALSFHQFFEGMGLGACISQARFRHVSTAGMAVFFSLTTPIGIGVGIGVSSVYSEGSSTALIVEGIFESASAGILIYMALVDLLAADFMDPRLQNNVRLQLGANLSLILGAGCMSALAKWV